MGRTTAEKLANYVEKHLESLGDGKYHLRDELHRAVYDRDDNELRKIGGNYHQLCDYFRQQQSQEVKYDREELLCQLLPERKVEDKVVIVNNCGSSYLFDLLVFIILLIIIVAIINSLCRAS